MWYTAPKASMGDGILDFGFWRMGTLDATLVRETLAGYAAANDVIEAERIEWLANLSNDEARAIDRSLYASWDGFPAWTKVGLERLEPLQLEGLLTIRQAFARMAAIRAAQPCHPG